MRTLTHDHVAALARMLCQRIGAPRYDLWFKDKTKFVCGNDRLTVGVPNVFYQDWLQKTFVEDIRAVALEVLGRKMNVVFVIDPELFQAARQQQERSKSAPASKKASADSAKPEKGTGAKAGPSRLRRWRRLDDFVVGACNRVAHASALAVVEDPSQVAYPLVFHGPCGIGKTHLLEGLCVALREAHPDARIVYLTAEEFTNKFLTAMQTGKLSTFRKQFRDADVLIVDDLQFLARKAATQEEFLHTLEALQRADRPVIVSCDCHPRLADQLLPELTDRLNGGSVWGINLPDKATRGELVRRKALRPHVPALTKDVVELLAQQLRGNVREIEGAVNSLVHMARVSAKPIDLRLAKEALGDVMRHSVRLVQISDVEQAVCRVMNLAKDDLKSKKRSWAVSHPRMLAMYLARKHAGSTYSEVGQHFGKRNHSTAVAAEKKVRQWLKDDASLRLGSRELPVRDLVERIEMELLK
ncbi:MAG: chromosomal replication initiator protein DnaA [Gemmataceae bacterium]|nr:chromosomal replication initiator protein DnaA [Gemmataceae bacterium]